MKIDNLVDAIPIESYKNKEEGFENKKKAFTIHLSAFYTSKKIANLSGLLSVDIKDVETLEIDKTFGLDGIIYIKKKPTDETRPIWANYLDKIHGKKVPGLETLSSSAVLLLRLEDGIIAFSFGYGRYLLNDDDLSSDFGIKAALNTLNHDTLRSVDLLSLDVAPIQKRSQATKSSNINDFGVDVSRDVLKAVTGDAIKGIPWHGISGSGGHYSFSATIFNYSELFDIAKEVAKKSLQPDYKDRFAWVDNIQRIKNGAEIEKLNNALLEKLKAKDTEKTKLTLPSIIDWGDIFGFSYTNSKKEYKSSPDISDYYLTNPPDEISIERLKSHRLFCHQSKDVEATSFSIYDCIYFEYSDGEKLHILFDKEWFTIDQDYIKRVNEALNLIPISEIAFPKVKMIPKEKNEKIRKGSKDANPKKESNNIYESEGDYNIRVSALLACDLLDKKLVKSDSSASPIEVCDLLMGNKFIHVKHKKGNSSGLSHLFAQGRVAAELLISDQKFRTNARTQLKYQSRKLIPEIKFMAKDYEVVFLVLGAKCASVREDLPFFSKINLVGAYRSLSERQYSVSIAGTDIEEVAVL